MPLRTQGGSWQVKTVVEMMGQSAVVATEQKVLLDDAISATRHGLSRQMRATAAPRS